MANLFYMVGVIKADSNSNDLLGFRLIQIDDGMHKESFKFKDIPYGNILSVLKSGSNIINIGLEGNKIVGTNGVLSRYPVIINKNKEIIGDKPILLARLVAGNKEGFVICNCAGNVAYVTADSLKSAIEKYGAANVKIVDNIISSIKGNYLEVKVEDNDDRVSKKVEPVQKEQSSVEVEDTKTLQQKPVEIDDTEDNIITGSMDDFLSDSGCANGIDEYIGLSDGEQEDQELEEHEDQGLVDQEQEDQELEEQEDQEEQELEDQEEYEPDNIVLEEVPEYRDNEVEISLSDEQMDILHNYYTDLIAITENFDIKTKNDIRNNMQIECDTINKWVRLTNKDNRNIYLHTYLIRNILATEDRGLIEIVGENLVGYMQNFIDVNLPIPMTLIDLIVLKLKSLTPKNNMCWQEIIIWKLITSYNNKVTDNKDSMLNISDDEYKEALIEVYNSTDLYRVYTRIYFNYLLSELIYGDWVYLRAQIKNENLYSKAISELDTLLKYSLLHGDIQQYIRTDKIVSTANIITVKSLLGVIVYSKRLVKTFGLNDLGSEKLDKIYLTLGYIEKNNYLKEYTANNVIGVLKCAHRLIMDNNKPVYVGNNTCTVENPVTGELEELEPEYRIVNTVVDKSIIDSGIISDSLDIEKVIEGCSYNSIPYVRGFNSRTPIMENSIDFKNYNSDKLSTFIGEYNKAVCKILSMLDRNDIDIQNYRELVSKMIYN